jgi:hypothetical protein
MSRISCLSTLTHFLKATVADFDEQEHASSGKIELSRRINAGITLAPESHL